MAIKRCPYCKAIIDEASGYCSNCGTQLLFPEDEFIEEKIPGDKIVEEEELPPGQPEEIETDEERLPEGKKEEAGFKPGEKEKAADTEEREKEEIERFLESVKKERTGKLYFKTEELDEIPDARTKERKEIERFLSSLREEKARKAPAAPKEEIPPSPGEKREEALKSSEEKIPIGYPEKIETDEQLPFKMKIEEKEKTGFKAAEVEKAPDAEAKEKEEIEGFLTSVKKERKEEVEIPEEKIPPTLGETAEGTSKNEELPPWAERMKESTPPEFAVDEEREREKPLDLGKDFEEEEEEILGDELPMPEKEVELHQGMEQIALPFGQEIEEKEEGLKKAPSRLSIWLKSRAFDFLSIAVLWVISLWLASRLMEVSLFKLVSASTLQVIGFYLILLVLYFSFFILLLGETLGDLLFSREK